MSVNAISFLNTLTPSRIVYRAPEVGYVQQGGLKNTFAGNVNLNAPSHADVCNARELLGDAVPGSRLCYCA